MAKPITPSEVANREIFIPDFVYEAFNELILDSFNGIYATVKQEAVLSRILKKVAEANATSVTGVAYARQDIFDNKWLDIEPHYRKAGWEVSYDRPSLHESYEPYFKFTAPKSN